MDLLNFSIHLEKGRGETRYARMVVADFQDRHELKNSQASYGLTGFPGYGNEQAVQTASGKNWPLLKAPKWIRIP